MADAFSAQLRAIDARNAAMAGIGRARAGIQYEKETEQQEEAKREIARKQEAEAGRAEKEAAKIAERGTWGGFIGGNVGRMLAKWGAKQAAGTAFKTVLGSTLGSIAIPAAAAYALSKALSHKKAKGFKGKEINEADIANIETEYFRKPQAKQIKYDLGQINTQIRSAGDIMKASRESIAQGFALQFGQGALQEQALASIFGGAGAGGQAGQTTETFDAWKKRMGKGGVAPEDLTMKTYKTMILNQSPQLLDPYQFSPEYAKSIGVQRVLSGNQPANLLNMISGQNPLKNVNLPSYRLPYTPFQGRTPMQNVSYASPLSVLGQR